MVCLAAKFIKYYDVSPDSTLDTAVHSVNPRFLHANCLRAFCLCWSMRTRHLRRAKTACRRPYKHPPQPPLRLPFAVCRKIKNSKFHTSYGWRRFSDSPVHVSLAPPLPYDASWPLRQPSTLNSTLGYSIVRLLHRWGCWPVSLLEWLTGWLVGCLAVVFVLIGLLSGGIVCIGLVGGFADIQMGARCFSSYREINFLNIRKYACVCLHDFIHCIMSAFCVAWLGDCEGRCTLQANSFPFECS